MIDPLDNFENDARDQARESSEQTSPVAEHAFNLGWDAARSFYACDDCDDNCECDQSP